MGWSQYMNAIVTGSRAYGNPRPDSDIDLVVLVSEDDMMNLVGVAGKVHIEEKMDEPQQRYGMGANAAVLRFGQLNLLVTTDPLQFEVWRRGTEAMKRYVQTHERLSRGQAIDYLQALRQHCGVSCDEPEPKVGDVFEGETTEW